jgi:hypothetical protein
LLGLLGIAGDLVTKYSPLRFGVLVAKEMFPVVPVHDYIAVVPVSFTKRFPESGVIAERRKDWRGKR